MNANDRDRRNGRRYDIRIPLHYRISVKGLPPRTGTSTTCEMSTAGVSFRSRKPLPVGAHIEMTAVWPAKFAHVHPVDLQMTGFIVRSDAGRTAVSITSRRFRVSGAAAGLPATA